MIPNIQTPLGRAYEADCLDFLRSVDEETVDLAFADPPFNLGKNYTSKINDSITPQAYIDWCELWLDEMVSYTKARRRTISLEPTEVELATGCLSRPNFDLSALDLR